MSEALRRLRRQAATRPDDPDWHAQLGVALRREGHPRLDDDYSGAEIAALYDLSADEARGDWLFLERPRLCARLRVEALELSPERVEVPLDELLHPRLLRLRERLQARPRLPFPLFLRGRGATRWTSLGLARAVRLRTNRVRIWLDRPIPTPLYLTLLGQAPGGAALRQRRAERLTEALLSWRGGGAEAARLLPRVLEVWHERPVLSDVPLDPKALLASLARRYGLGWLGGEESPLPLRLSPRLRAEDEVGRIIVASNGLARLWLSAAADEAEAPVELRLDTEPWRELGQELGAVMLLAAVAAAPVSYRGTLKGSQRASWEDCAPLRPLAQPLLPGAPQAVRLYAGGGLLAWESRALPTVHGRTSAALKNLREAHPELPWS